jgi:hypothetical protein
VLSLISIIYLVAVVTFFFLVGFLTNANPGAVLLGLAPALLFGVALLILIETDQLHPTYNWFLLVGILVVASIVYYTLPAARGLDAPTVLFLDGILMAIGVLIIHFSAEREKPLVQPHAPAVQHTEVVHVHHLPKQQDITEYIHSIEDKVKALNFVIGRVYSVYHGGTNRMRNKIRIDKAWYDDFNQIDEQDIEKRKHEAIVLVQKIKDRLDLMQQSEREVFGNDATNIKNVARNPAGTDSVIAVLTRNDKDPVQQYYDGARTFCEEALKKLKE